MSERTPEQPTDLAPEQPTDLVPHRTPEQPTDLVPDLTPERMPDQPAGQAPDPAPNPIPDLAPDSAPDQAAPVPAQAAPVPARGPARRPCARVSLGAMLGQGLRGLRDHVRLFACLYLVQLAIASGAAWVAGRLVLGAWGRSLELEQAAAGDLAALVFLLRDQPQVAVSILWILAGAVALYAALSCYLAGGLNAVLLLRPGNPRDSARVFGAGSALTFPAYLRLALLSLIAHALIALAAGTGAYLVKPRLAQAMTVVDMLAALAPALVPCLLLWWVHATATRYARIALSLRALSAGSQMLRAPAGMGSDIRPGGPPGSLIGSQARRPSAVRCLLAAYGLVLSGWAPLVHMLLYALWFVLVSAALVGITWPPVAAASAAGATAMGGTSVLLLLALRQTAALLRSAGAFVLAGGQVLAMARSREASPASSPSRHSEERG